MGVVLPLGHSAESAFERARVGRSAIRRLDFPSIGRLAAPIGAPVDPFNGADYFDPPKLRMLDRISQFALAAAGQALADARPELTLAERGRTGVFVGTGMGRIDDGYHTLYGENSDRIKPFMILLGMHNAPAAWIGIAHSLSGPNLTYSTACSSSAVAIGEAWGRLRRGELDVAIAGAAEAPLSLGSMKAWDALRTGVTVDENDPSASCKPFAANRSGMVLGEGAAMRVLESWGRAVARGARIYGEIIGYGLFTDAGHVIRPSIEGQAAALQSAGIDASQVDAINAHGTGTLANDCVETAATKALHGHLLGAASALECVLSVVAMRHAVALPTLHLQQADLQCDLHYVANAAREGMQIRTMLSNSFAFGGTNAVLALRAGP